MRTSGQHPVFQGCLSHEGTPDVEWIRGSLVEQGDVMEPHFVGTSCREGASSLGGEARPQVRGLEASRRRGPGWPG